MATQTVDLARLRAEIRHLASCAPKHDYTGPTPQAIEAFIRLCEIAASHGVHPRPIQASKAADGAAWLTFRGLNMEELSLCARANNHGVDIRGEIEIQKQSACAHCRLAKETGHHTNTRIISHEELQCRHCGAFIFWPDAD